MERKAQKLLSFTDNRQDASLQAGHFNDFVEVTMLRSALWRAVSASPGGVRHDVLPQRVFDALALPRTSYALNPDLRGQARLNTDRTMRQVLAYRLYRDLRRGWRVTQPNLDRSVCSLSSTNRYRSWPPTTRSGNGAIRLWQDAPRSGGSRSVALLDWIRRELAVRVDVLNDRHQEALRLRAGQWLAGSWSLGAGGTGAGQGGADPPKRGGDRYWWRHVTGRGTFGRFLAQRAALGSATGAKLTVPERDRIIREIFAGLNAYGLLIQVGGREPGHERWQISSGAMIWKPGDGTPVPDPLRMSIAGRGFEPQANSFFQERYRNPGTDLAAMEGREHTAQVSGEQRQERERRFRAGDLPVISVRRRWSWGLTSRS